MFKKIQHCQLRCSCMAFAALALLLITRNFSYAEEPLAIPSVEAVGFCIVNPSISLSNSNSFRWPVGSKIAVMASVQDAAVLSVNIGKSTLEYLQDDLGTDLRIASVKNEQDWQPPYGIQSNGFNSHRAHNKRDSVKKSLLFTISGPGTPAFEASNIRCKGTLVLTCAQGTRNEDVKDIKAAIGTVIKSTGVTFTISKISEDGQSLSFKTEDDITQIQRITFLDAQEKPLDNHRRGTSSHSNDKKTVTTWTYQFKQKLESFTMRIESWTEKRDVEIDFYFKVNLGVAAP